MGIEIFHANVVHDDFSRKLFMRNFVNSFVRPVRLTHRNLYLEFGGVMSGFGVQRVTDDSRALLDDQRFRLR